MEPAQRIITELPLKVLWNDAGEFAAACLRELSASDICDLLQKGRVHFLVANVGAKPRWIPESGCFDFWKREVKAHIAKPGEPVYLESFPGEYFYFASEWQVAGWSPIVVLEMYH